MRKINQKTIAAIRESPTIIAKLAELTGLRTATIELYLRTGRLKRLSSQPVEQALRRWLKLPKEAEIVTETDNN